MHNYDDLEDDEPTFPTGKLPRARVLVVEDDPRFRGIVSSRLKRDGYDVYEASNGTEAITMLHFINDLGWPTDQFELVILDNHLPGNNGIEILRRLRDDHDRTPVLLMTAYPDASLIDEAGSFGAAVLEKPFSLDRLCDATIATILANQPSPARVGGIA